MRRILPVFLAATLLALTPPDARATATSVQANAAHTGNAGNVGLRLPLRRAWKVSLPGGVSYPVAADGRVFVVHYRPWTVGGIEVVAMAIRTGRVLWRRDLGKDARSAALGYGDGRLVVGRESYFDPGDPSAVLALDPADGHVLWEQGTGMFDGNPPVVDGGTVFIKGMSGYGVSALRLSDGAVLWSLLTDSGDLGAPAVDAASVFAVQSGCPDVHRIRRTDGFEIWHPENGCHGGGGSTPALYRGRLYVLETPQHPPADVYDAETGAHVTRVRADLLPVFAGDLGVFPDARRPRDDRLYGHRLVARDLGSGKLRWRFRGDGYLDGAPLISSGVVYVGSGSGRLYGVSLRSGRAVWRSSAGAPVPAPGLGAGSGLAAADGTLFVPALGRLLAFR